MRQRCDAGPRSRTRSATLSSIDGSTELGGPGNVVGSDIKWFGSVNAKAGYAMDRLLVYGIGGIAFAGIDTSQSADTSLMKEIFVATKAVAASRTSSAVAWLVTMTGTPRMTRG